MNITFSNDQVDAGVIEPIQQSTVVDGLAAVSPSTPASQVGVRNSKVLPRFLPWVTTIVPLTHFDHITYV